MADPFTLAVGATVLGTGLSAYGQHSAGKAEAKAAKQRAAIDRRNAQFALEDAELNAEIQQRKAKKAIGLARANYGASGVTLEGSALDVLEESVANAEIDRQTILRKGRLRAMGFEESADLEESRAKAARRQGNIGAASEVLMGGARVFNMLP